MRATPTFVVSTLVCILVVGSVSAAQAEPRANANQSGTLATSLAPLSGVTTASALSRAASKGAPVVVDDLTTPTSVTRAMPDGSMQLEQSTVPVRVPRDGGWVDVDTELERDGDWFSPTASVAGVRFSSGGSDVIAQTQTTSGEWVSERWTQGTLPTPTVEGDTATYAEVLPDVDLKLTATSNSEELRSAASS
ncbi:hypothetical protein [Microbacterium sp. MYb64]|uniref:hypothetical protein n=1 Tax=Microbacterium sp. MYb64 TaxID=1848691 RepID=UPI0011B07A36|nr:hypothetical protein [Microbacterium sp. MYb64]